VKERNMSAENLAGRDFNNEEFEEITSDEVDRVVEQLENLMESVSSENIKAHLDDAINSIFFLVYDEEGEGEGTSDAA
jgi:uncharacterized FlaG/YvyC family protein